MPLVPSGRRKESSELRQLAAEIEKACKDSRFDAAAESVTSLQSQFEQLEIAKTTE
jgi:hypothetical protein